MTLGILSVFALAGAAPLIQRFAGARAGWLLAGLPLVILCHFWILFGRILGGEIISEHRAWLPAMGLQLSLRADGLSLLFGLLIAALGALVLIYAGGYLANNPRIGAFYAFTLAFMGSMLGLVFSDNLLLLFVFWELTSVSSYFLIGFYHEREPARRAALQALLVTAGGGLALLAGFLLLAQAGGTYEISRLGEQGSLAGHGFYNAILVLILIGAFSKSAQFPLHFWLPNAMEAPAPASAYLHAATMVKAGIFLMARLNPVLGGTDAWRWTLTLFGCASMLVGAWSALQATDLKRMLAYSTVSALGTMTCLLGLGTQKAFAAMALFLIGHALYKGCLFLAAGSIDHETGERDAQRLGGLRTVMPVTAAAAFIAALSMAALPPSIGFLGKEGLYGSLLADSRWRWLMAAAVTANAFVFAAAFITGARPFLGAQTPTPKWPHEAPLAMRLGPALLALLGVLLPFSPAPALLARSAAAAISAGPPVDVDTGLWHGWSPELSFSAVTALGGLAVLAGWGFIRRLGARLSDFPIPSPERLYFLGLDTLGVIARVQTRALQSGYLRSYIRITLVAALILVGSGISRWPDLPFAAPRGAKPWEIIVMGLVVFSALAAATAPGPMTAIAAMGAAGYGVALLYIFFGAPDLAMTQFAVESLTVILFILVFHRLPKPTAVSKALPRAADAIVALSVGGLMTCLVLAAHKIQASAPISSYFGARSVEAAHGRNVVNVILVDFRAFDTLGEITVLALAAAGVLALINLRELSKKR